MISIAMVINDFNINGISTVVLNYCRHIDKNKFSVTIITGSPADDRNIEECKKIGVNIKILPSRKKKSLAFYIALFKEISKKKYDIVHVHGNSAMITPDLLIAWIKGIKKRIAHSHNSTCSNMKGHNFFYPLFQKMYTHGFACSSLAGNWLFENKDFYVIPNGFDVKKFKFNEDSRIKIRNELGLDTQIVIGHIGRFNSQKNHEFLLKIFENIASINDDMVLLLVGDGPDFNKIMSIIKTHKYKERIIVYGETNKTEDVYSAMDLFLFPSKHEGLGIVALEAQISGLPCIVSDVLPKEVIIGNNIVFKNLSDTIEEWSNLVFDKLNSILPDRTEYFENNYADISKYDILDDVKLLEKLYNDIAN